MDLETSCINYGNKFSKKLKYLYINNRYKMNKETQISIKIPEQIQSLGPLLGAVYVEFGDTECLATYNNKALYFLQIVQNAVVKFSSYNVSNIENLVSLIKGYLLITTKEQKLWLFELKKIQKKQEAPKEGSNQQKSSTEQSQIKVQKSLTVESFLKQIPFASYFLREVTPNMIQLFLTTFNTDKSQKVLYVYQFTVKQKVGGMGFTVDKNYKIVSQSRKQLYASKNFFDPAIKSLIKLKNFSDVIFSTKKINEDYLYFIPIGKTEEYCFINKNQEIVNAQNTNNKKKIREQLNGFSLKNGIQHLNYLLLQSEEGTYGLFVIQQSLKIKHLGTLNDYYLWHVCFNGKAVGVNKNGKQIVVTEELNKKTQKISSQKTDQLVLQSTVAIETKEEGVKQSPIKQQVMQQKSSELASKSEQKINKQQVKIKDQQKRSNQQIKTEISAQKPIQQAEPSKHKSTFKPTKVLSRKDLKKQNKNEAVEKIGKDKQIQSPNTSYENVQKQQQTVSQQVKNEQKPIKKQQKLPQKAQNTPKKIESKLPRNSQQKNQNILKTPQAEQSGQKKGVKKEQPEACQKSNSNTKQEVVTPKQQKTTISNPFINVKNQQKNIESPIVKNPFMKNKNQLQADSSKNNVSPPTKKSLSPFTKKNVIPNIERLNFVPPVSYEQIFGSKSPSAIIKSSNESKNDNQKQKKISMSIFEKSQLKIGQKLNQKQEKTEKAQKTQKSEKKPQPKQLIDKTLPKQEQKEQPIQKLTKQVESDKKQKQAQNFQINSDSKEHKNKEKVVETEAEIKEQKNSNEQCCTNYQQTKTSYDLFSAKVTALQAQSEEVINNYQKVTKQMCLTLQEKFANAQKQLLGVSQQKLLKSSTAVIQTSVNDYLSKRLTPKVNDYFRNVALETKKIYDQTLKFYAEKKKQTIANLQNHFQQQEHLVSEIRQISANTIAAVQNTINEGEESHAYLIRQWNKCTKNLTDKLDRNMDALNAHTCDRSASQRQKIIDSVVELRQTLQIQNEKQKSAKQQQKQIQQNKKKQKKVKQEQDHSQKQKKTKHKKSKQYKKYRQQVMRKQYLMRMQQPYTMTYPYPY